MALGRVRRRLQHHLDPLVAAEGDAATRRLDPWRPEVLRLEAPPSHDHRPRWGHGRARHPQLTEIIGRHHDRYREELEGLLAYTDDLRRIAPRGPEGTPHWLNRWLPGLDTVALYGFTRRLGPRRYVEVGSGHSTLVVDRARQDGGLATTITSFDPQPRTEVDARCDLVVRQPLELADLTPLREVEAGDIVFFDGSHRVFTSSDTVVFYLDVLPSLPDGVVVGVHDVLWPDDYLPEWRDYWFGEQYLLGALLLGEPRWLQPLFAAHYACTDPELAALTADLWATPGLDTVDRRGFSYWFRIDRSAPA